MIAIWIIQAQEKKKSLGPNFFGLNYQLADDDHHSDSSKSLLLIQNVPQAKPLGLQGT